jgi:hypothetical protein
MYISLEVVNVCMDHSAEHSICLHCDPYTMQTRTQDHIMPYIDYLQANVHYILIYSFNQVLDGSFLGVKVAGA